MNNWINNSSEEQFLLVMCVLSFIAGGLLGWVTAAWAVVPR